MLGKGHEHLSVMITKILSQKQVVFVTITNYLPMVLVPKKQGKKGVIRLKEKLYCYNITTVNFITITE